LCVGPFDRRFAILPEALDELERQVVDAPGHRAGDFGPRMKIMCRPSSKPPREMSPSSPSTNPGGGATFGGSSGALCAALVGAGAAGELLVGCGVGAPQPNTSNRTASARWKRSTPAPSHSRASATTEVLRVRALR
jgi:hypothetical protein